MRERDCEYVCEREKNRKRKEEKESWEGGRIEK